MTQHERRQRQIDKLLDSAPRRIDMRPGELMGNPWPIPVEIIRFANLERQYAKRRAKQAHQRIIDELLADAHRRD